MPSYIPAIISTTYEEIVNLREVPNLTRKGFSIQNQAQTIIWVRVGDVGEPNVAEFAFLPNVAILIDYAGDLLRSKLFIKAEAPVNNRRVILSVW